MDTTRVERIYRRSGQALKRAVMLWYRCSPDEADVILKEALKATIAGPDAIDNEWFIGAGSREASTGNSPYAFEAGVPPDPAAEEVEALRAKIFLRRATEALSKEAQEALRLRYHERCSYEEIAKQLDVTVRYAQRLVFGSLQKLRRRTGAR
jgi:DNA-directed RNA polymerase specialized sigma subunit, sigma24 homolog